MRTLSLLSVPASVLAILSLGCQTTQTNGPDKPSTGTRSGAKPTPTAPAPKPVPPKPPTTSWQGRISSVQDARNDTSLQLGLLDEVVTTALRDRLAAHPSLGRKLKFVTEFSLPETERLAFEVEPQIRSVTFRPILSPDNLRAGSSTASVVEVTVELGAKLTRHKFGKQRVVQRGPATGKALARRVAIELAALKAGRVTVGAAKGEMPPVHVEEAIRKANKVLADDISRQIMKD